MAVLCQYSVEGLCCICITTGCIQAPSVCGTHYGSGANLTAVAGTLPTGSIVNIAGATTPPTGFLCTGACYAQSSYSTLYNCIGLFTDNAMTTFGTTCVCTGPYSCAAFRVGGYSYSQICRTVPTNIGLVANLGTPTASVGDLSTAYLSSTDRYLWMWSVTDTATGLCAYVGIMTSCSGICGQWCATTTSLATSCITSRDGYGNITGGYTNVVDASGFPDIRLIHDNTCRAAVIIGFNCGMAGETICDGQFKFMYTVNGGTNWTNCTNPTGMSSYFPSPQGLCNDRPTTPLAFYNPKCNNFLVIPRRCSCVGAVFCSILQTADFNTWCGSPLAHSVCDVRTPCLFCTSCCSVANGWAHYYCGFNYTTSVNITAHGGAGSWILCCDPISTKLWLYPSGTYCNGNQFFSIDTSGGTACLVRYCFSCSYSFGVINIFNGRLLGFNCCTCAYECFCLTDFSSRSSQCCTTLSVGREAYGQFKNIDGNYFGFFGGATADGISFMGSVPVGCYNVVGGYACYTSYNWTTWWNCSNKCITMFPAPYTGNSGANIPTCPASCNCFYVMHMSLYPYNYSTTFRTPIAPVASNPPMLSSKQKTFIKT